MKFSLYFLGYEDVKVPYLNVQGGVDCHNESMQDLRLAEEGTEWSGGVVCCKPTWGGVTRIG